HSRDPSCRLLITLNLTPMLSTSHTSYPPFFFFKHPATTEIYTLSLHDALPIWGRRQRGTRRAGGQQFEEVCIGSQKSNAPRSGPDRKSTRLNSSHVAISYAVFCLKKKKKIKKNVQIIEKHITSAVNDAND